MKNYYLNAYKRGNYMVPNEALLNDEYMESHCSVFLSEFYVKDGSRVYNRYRLRTSKPEGYVDTFEYDIKCPHCQDTLRLCGLPLDSTTHGLYKCRRCDQEEKRRRSY